MEYISNSLTLYCYSVQNGTIEEVKKIVSFLNEAEVPSEDVVGKKLLYNRSLSYH